ncbi:MAG: MinD/ParA family protein [Thermotogae bacterium]|nr:MinD/ParA family protein [Thermotogota bacterium]
MMDINSRIDQARGLREAMMRNTEIVVFSSGKGGVGKSVVATNFSLELVRMGKKVLLLDADIGLANVEIMLGVVPTYSVIDLIRGERSLEDITFKTEYGLDLLSGGNGITEAVDMSNEMREYIIGELSKISFRNDYVIIDTGAGISKNVVDFLQFADRVYVVLTMEPTSITDAYTLIKVMKTRGITSRIYMILNRVENATEGRKILDRLRIAIKRFLDVNIDGCYFIREDKMIPRSIKDQQPLAFTRTHSLALLSIDKIVSDLVNGDQGVVSKKESFPERLLKFFGIVRKE